MGAVIVGDSVCLLAEQLRQLLDKGSDFREIGGCFGGLLFWSVEAW